MARRKNKSKNNSNQKSTNNKIPIKANPDNTNTGKTSNIKEELKSHIDNKIDSLNQIISLKIEERNTKIDELSKFYNGMESKLNSFNETMIKFKDEIESKIDEESDKKINNSIQEKFSKVISGISEEFKKEKDKLEKEIQSLHEAEEFAEEERKRLYKKVVEYNPGGMKALEQEIEKQQELISDLHEQIVLLKEENSKLRKKNYELNNVSDGINIDNFNIIKEENIKLKNELQINDYKIIKQENQSLTAEIQVLRDKYSELENKNIEIIQYNDDVKELKELKNKFNVLEEKTSDLENENRTLINQKRRLKDTIRNLDVQITEQTNDIALADSINNQNEELKKTITQLQEENSNLEDIRISKEQELATAQNRISELSKTEDEIKSKYREEISNIIHKDYEKKINDNYTKIKSEYENTIKKLDEENDRNKEIIDKWRIRYNDLIQPNSDLQRKKEKLETDIAHNEQHLSNIKNEIETLKKEKLTVETEIQELKNKIASINGEISAAQKILENLQENEKMIKVEIEKLKKEEESIDPNRRKQSIITPFFEGDLRNKIDKEYTENEIEWLNNIKEKIKESGFEFHDRLINSFHTSLKIANISPLTVLAGFSGTGKSELPRLYSEIGGINFLNYPVQPNWDSPLDLFGFFNYTDKSYNATPLTQALYQATLSDDQNNSIKNQMLIILLDEMNLARIEYYFSELLSKLELRRNFNDTKILEDKRFKVELNLGSGCKSEWLPLLRNILFVGTINEDETTLSLSDKVIDRANVVTFPRPKSLKNKELKENIKNPNKISKDVWDKWISNNENKLNDDRKAEIETKFNKINENLEYVNRAIGHRVFQAIYKYIELYPEVNTNENFQNALEDQIVQKILPKLKGIDCNSNSGKKCLGNIKSLIPESLGDDFEKSTKMDYFEWLGSPKMYEIKSD